MTLIGTVSPPGGNFAEPMTQNSLRMTGTFWGLDTALARRRHFPAINWTSSYSLYKLAAWCDRQVAADWSKQRQIRRACTGALCQSRATSRPLPATTAMAITAPRHGGSRG